MTKIVLSFTAINTSCVGHWLCVCIYVFFHFFFSFFLCLSMGFISHFCWTVKTDYISHKHKTSLRKDETNYKYSKSKQIVCKWKMKSVWIKSELSIIFCLFQYAFDSKRLHKLDWHEWNKLIVKTSVACCIASQKKILSCLCTYKRYRKE